MKASIHATIIFVAITSGVHTSQAFTPNSSAVEPATSLGRNRRPSYITEKYRPTSAIKRQQKSISTIQRSMGSQALVYGTAVAAVSRVFDINA